MKCGELKASSGILQTERVFVKRFFGKSAEPCRRLTAARVATYGPLSFTDEMEIP